MKRINDWFRIKKYPHIGLPLVESDRLWVEKYVSNPANVAKHAFFPFIHRTMLTRKFRKEYDEFTDEITNEGLRKKSEKIREIFYANHIDSNVFSYYTTKIGKIYEEELVRRNLSDFVTAYRNIPHPTKRRGMNNVDFAEEVFSFIRRQKTPVLVAITFDIKSFFDNLNHLRLKYAWASLLRLERLPPDHYNIFKAITKFSFIDIKSLFNVTKNDLIKYGKSGAIERVAVKDIENLRNQEIVAFCTTKELRSKIRPAGIIKANKFIKNTDGTLSKSKREKGIPQGSPISSILANLYLMDFDSKIAEAVKECGGLYRRYSDDIVVVTPESSGERLCNLVLTTIKEYDLEIQASKTNSYKFQCSPQGYVCGKILPNGNLNIGRRFTYLGFEFNGSFTYLKSSSLSSFYRRMKNSVKRGSFYAKFSNYEDGRGEIFRRRLFKKFSYLGARRKMQWDFNEDEKKWKKSYRHEWGNYLTYANMAHFNMKNSKIRGQVRNHWLILNHFIKKHEAVAKKI
ncbi:reverse transcriptase domain-containing protein [Candidatus Electronema sp. JC]|uniref:reverse transcriptase domain-containing protein n=1 Tax=Candidatus Electronema sp. JC TaxID=3401570 RepID=UPI003B432B61